MRERPSRQFELHPLTLRHHGKSAQQTETKEVKVAPWAKRVRKPLILRGLDGDDEGVTDKNLQNHLE